MIHNKQAIVEHLTKLFGRCEEEYPDGKIQIDAGGQGKWLSDYFPATTDGINEAAEYAIARNKDKFNLYVGVNPRKPSVFPGSSATDDDIEVSFFNFADLDTPEATAALKTENPIQYTFAVTTGKIPTPRVHAYWEREHMVRNLSAWKDVQIGMSNLFHGDKVIDPRRIMRLAGCVSYPPQKKQERGYKDEIVTIRTEYDDDRDPVSGVHLHNTFKEYLTKNNEIIDNEILHSPTETDPLGLGTGAHTDVTAAIKNVLKGDCWHNNVIKLVAHWVSRGFSDAEIMLYCPAITTPGYTLKDTQYEVGKAITSARTKFNVPEVTHNVTDVTVSLGALQAEKLGALDISSIPVRRFIYGEHLISEYISATVSPGGVGKTTLVLTEAIAMCVGKDLIHDRVHEPEINVWHYNLEDPRDELLRRVAAICQFYKVDTADIANKLFLNSGRDRPLIVAKKDESSGVMIATPDAEALQKAITDNNIRVLSVDPFVKSHYADENNNMEIDAVMNVYAQIAKDTGCAIDLIHHVRKAPSGPTQSAAGDINQARGASSIAGAVRSARTITAMTKKEAEKLGMASGQSCWFIRIDDAKGNMSAPSERAVWMERKSELLNNGSQEGLINMPGDSVGILAKWKLPDAFDGVSTAKAREILVEIGRGKDGEKPYMVNSAGKYWAGNVIMELCANKSKTDAKQMLKEWVDVEYLEKGRDRTGDHYKEADVYILTNKELPS